MDGADLRAMRALTHPLRLDLMELLATSGPATAAACGRALGVPQANCSFHLRQLAKYGYVEQADQGTDRRERRWQVIAGRSALRYGPDSDGLVKRRLERLVVERQTRAILDYVDRHDERDPRDSNAGIIAGLLSVTPEEAAELRRQWLRLVEPYLVAPQPADAGSVAESDAERTNIRVFMAMTPMTPMTPNSDTDQGASGDEYDG